MKAKRIAALLAAGLLAATCLGVLAACSQNSNSEQLIRESVSKELDGMKSLDDASMKAFTSDVASSEVSALETLGIDVNDFAKSYMKGFDYKINDVKVEGNKATVSLTLTCKSQKEVTAAITAASQKLMTDPSLMQLSDSERLKKVGSEMLASLDTVQAKDTAPIDVGYELKGNTWQPTDQAMANLTSAILTS